MKGTWMLVISFRGVNFRFWSRLGCSGYSPLHLAVKDCSRKNIKKLYIFNSFYSLDSCNRS